MSQLCNVRDVQIPLAQLTPVHIQPHLTAFSIVPWGEGPDGLSADARGPRAGCSFAGVGVAGSLTEWDVQTSALRQCGAGF